MCIIALIIRRYSRAAVCHKDAVTPYRAYVSNFLYLLEYPHSRTEAGAGQHLNCTADRCGAVTSIASCLCVIVQGFQAKLTGYAEYPAVNLGCCATPS